MTRDAELVGVIGTEQRLFGDNEERAIVSIALDKPEFFTGIGKHIKHQFFKQVETQYVYAIIEKLFEENDIVPTRAMVRDHALRNLTADDDYESILAVIDRPSDPREVPYIKDLLLNWARKQAFGMIYSEEGISAYEGGDYERVEEIIEEAKKITDVSQKGFWFFDEMESLFEITSEQKLTCGYPKLDQFLNDGGPTRKEVFAWMAPTGVGKSIMLPNSGIANIKRGCKVAHFTLELSAYKTGLRYAGAFTNIPIHQRFDHRVAMKDALSKIRNTYKGDLVIYEFPPDEVSVDHIYQVLDQLERTRSFVADVVVIDYLELMISRKAADNKDDYVRQKKVATQVRGLAKNKNVLIFTATQTNRSESESKKSSKNAPSAPVGGAPIDVNRIAESYGKAMPLDYLVSINQSVDEYNSKNPMYQFYIAKNRNGQKHKMVTATVDYQTFRVVEAQATKATKK
jgi:replicative DNA helicase